jgi:nucleoside-diphosphate-sugar epimerase
LQEVNLLIVGCGYAGAAVARRANARGIAARATTRTEGHAPSLRACGVEPIVVNGALSAAALEPHVDATTRVLVTIPPDGSSDRAIAPPLARAASIAYLSSTGVYGDARGRVDELTPLHATTPRAIARVAAERVWRDVGATIVRAPGFYGPGRGMHLRLARNELRIAGDATNAISRVHVDDLAEALLTLLERAVRGEVYVVGDREPTPHVEVVRWIADALGLPMPPHDPASEADESLRHDRRIDSARIRTELGLTLAYPTYREGYGQCIEVDRAALDAAIAGGERTS